MSQSRPTGQAQGNPLDLKGLCVLSLDGGGVRGLSTLLIVKALMAKVNAERKNDGLQSVKPCEIFNLIGGTSTGGIIAIMLGRLEMDVGECIDAYTSMFQTIFGKKGLPVNRWGQIKGRFDSTVLEKCIQKILEARGLCGAELLNDGKERCKVAVCAKAFEVASTVLLRSYKSNDELNNSPATICEAVRATSAATSFFEPVTIGPYKRRYVDGALGANNPVEQLWNEAQNIWCHGTQVELGSLLKCFISIGTGNPGRKPISEGSFKFLSETLVRIATQTEDTAKIFVERHRQLLQEKRYFRFNVQQGLQDVGLEEYQATALIDAATAEYMDGQEIRTASQECAMNLKKKQCQLVFSCQHIIEWNSDYISRQKTITFVPFNRNEGLVDRDDIFRSLNKLVLSSSHNRSAAIWGLGGCGKTQIALEYAYRQQENTSCSIFWVHADSESRFTQDYSHLSKIAGLSTELKGEDLLRAVQQWIEQQGNWILILDNADDLRIFKNMSSDPQDHTQSLELLRFVPKAQRGTIVWTSRDRRILGSMLDVSQGLEVGAMTSQESWALFQRLSMQGGRKLSQNEDKLLELLQRLPLAIAQAAAYIRITSTPVQKYIEFLSESESRQSKLLSQEFPDTYRSGVPNSVMHTWRISMKQIAKENPCSERILNTIAFLDNKGLPFNLLKAAAGISYTEDEVLLAAGRLIDYSFFQAKIADGEGLPDYEQHRLVHLAARKALSDVQTRSFSGEALNVILNLFPNGTYEGWSTCELYLSHAQKAVKWVEAENYKDDAPPLLENMGRYYWEQGRSDEAERLEIEVLELRKEVVGEKHPDTILAMANLASTWEQQGRSDEAERLQIEVLELRKEVVGEKHPDTIRAMANLASTWQQQGRSDEAERLQIEVLELRKEVVGEKHPDTIRAMANLAGTWWQQGRSDEADRLEIEVLELRKEVVGVKHPDTIRAMANLAGTWRQQGRSDEAERLQIEVLELYKEVIGEQHPNTIQTANNLKAIRRQADSNDRQAGAGIQSIPIRPLEPTPLNTGSNRPHLRFQSLKGKLKRKIWFKKS